MNNEWITDRKPTRDDGLTVYDRNGSVCQFFCIAMGDPWKPIPQIEPYVKPKRWKAVYRVFTAMGQAYASWVIIDSHTYNEIRTELWKNTDEHRKAAEEIATIYERTLP